MGRDEEMATDQVTCNNDDVKSVEIAFDKDAVQNLNSIHDEVMLRILEDAHQSGEPLKVIKVRIWDPKTETAKFDVNDSTVLELMYGKLPKK